MRNEVNGSAIIECKLAVKRQLDDCQVISESQPGYGFGIASLSMAKARAILAPSSMASLAPATTVQLEVPFILPH